MLEDFYSIYTIPVCLLLQKHDQIGLEMQSLQIKIVDTTCILLVFTYHVIKPKNCNHSINKVTNKGYDR